MNNKCKTTDKSDGNQDYNNIYVSKLKKNNLHPLKMISN